MSDTIKHRHQTAIANSGADVDQNEWNDSHVFAGGVDGQVVTRNSGAADGWGWTTPAAGAIAGYPVLLEEHSANNTATTLTFTARNKNPSVGGTGVTFQSDYDVYLVEFVQIVLATNDAGLVANVSTNGGSSWDTSAIYGRGYQYGATNNTSSGGGEVSQTRWNVTGNQTNASTSGASGAAKLFLPTSTVCHKQMIGQILYAHTSVDVLDLQFGLVWKSASAFTAIQFSTTTGNIVSGAIRISGVTK